MVQLETLKFLAAQKIRDAEILLNNGRNTGAVYMMGYALEFSLKRKISLTLGFNSGFPENKSELTIYSSQLRLYNGISTGIQLIQINQIRNHNLQHLLIFSGAEYRIKSQFLPQWLLVKHWNPEERYVRRRITNKQAIAFTTAAKQIVREIL